MAYHVVDPASLAPDGDHPCDRRSITAAVGLTTLALAVYDLAPGEPLAVEYHSHERREEAFYVLAGELHIETPGEEFVVGRGEVFVVKPGSPIRPFNPPDADGTVRVVGMGAPLYDVGLPFEG